MKNKQCIILLGDDHRDVLAQIAEKEILQTLFEAGIRIAFCSETPTTHNLQEVLQNYELIIEHKEKILQKAGILQKLGGIELVYQKEKHIMNNVELIPQKDRLNIDRYLASVYRNKKLGYLQQNNIPFYPIDHPSFTIDNVQKMRMIAQIIGKDDVEEEIEKNRIASKVKEIDKALKEGYPVVLCTLGAGHTERLAATLIQHFSETAQNIDVHSFLIGQECSSKKMIEVSRHIASRATSTDLGAGRNPINRIDTPYVTLKETSPGKVKATQLEEFATMVSNHYKPKFYIPDIDEKKKHKVTELGGTLNGNWLTVDSRKLSTKKNREALGIDCRRLKAFSNEQIVAISSQEYFTLERESENTFLVTFPDTKENLEFLEKTLEIEKKPVTKTQPANQSNYRPLLYLALAVAAVAICYMTFIGKLVESSNKQNQLEL